MIEELTKLHKHYAPLYKGDLPEDLIKLADEVRYSYKILCEYDDPIMSRQIAAMAYTMWRMKTGRASW